MQKSTSPPRWFIAVLLTGIGAVACVAVLFFRPRAPRQLNPAEAQALIHAKNLGVGYLENHQVEVALQAFAPIAEKLPDEPLLVRNRAVAHVLSLGEDDDAASEQAISAARQSLAKLAQRQGDTDAYHWLMLRLAFAAGDDAGAQTQVAALLKSESENAAPYYAQFLLDQRANRRELTPAAVQSLDNARRLAPANSWLLVEWLRATGRQLMIDVQDLPAAEMQTKYKQLAEHLRTARPVITPFAYELRLHARQDVLATLEQAATAANSQNWQEAASAMLALANVLVPRTVLDRQAIRRHPLEFVANRFDPAFYAAHQLTEIETAPAIDVSFSAVAVTQPQLDQILDAAWVDFDLDGKLDIVLLGPAEMLVWSRREATWEVLTSIKVSGLQRIVAQDLDSDFDETLLAIPRPQEETKLASSTACRSADVDIVACGESGIQLFENRFVVESKQRELVPKQIMAEQQNITALECADVEADGDLDLVFSANDGLQIWSNNGDWTFSNISDRSSLPGRTVAATQILAIDWDRDVDIDLLVAAASGGGWLENLRHGQLRWRPFADGWPALQKARALATVDANADASWDVIGADEQGLHLLKTISPTAGLVQASATTSISASNIEHLLTWDYDNDGWEDLLSWTSDEVQLYRGISDGTFPRVDLLPQNLNEIRTVCSGDFDADGDLDVLLVAGDQLQIYENRGGNRNHWIDVELLAQQEKSGQLSPSGRSTPYGVGSLLELKSGSHYQAKLVRGPVTHFGLGQQSQCDVIRVLWLNGVPQNLVRPKLDVLVCEPQVLQGSCPYLYTWNGERFTFVTDLLWNAPLGLQLAEGKLAPAREWEYLKIPSEALAPKDGKYVLQLTEELWEASYFDQVQLIAIDHPADFEIYSNEKVGPPSIAGRKIHTVRQPRTPIGAKNHVGRDLLSEIHSDDGTYAKTYERKLRQGLTEDHFLELDLGDLKAAKHVKLFLTGWVFSAGTSINVAVSQGQSLAPAKPPSLQVPDGSGGWKEALPFMGFPGGKTKTIVIDLTDVVTKEDGRVRIATSMELYWDHIFFTVDEPVEEVQTTELKMLSAGLHYRGFSRIELPPGNGPEEFLYSEVSTAPKWPPMLGRFTRYGDVAPLLTHSDDQLLVVGAGDEVTLEFEVPKAALPPGWKRDFLLHNVGWDKDCNLVTVFGETVEPMPFRAMTSYPWPADEKTPDSSEYREYLAKYQTRRQTSEFWNTIRRPARP
jgi:hypothetical protein